MFKNGLCGGLNRNTLGIGEELLIFFGGSEEHPALLLVLQNTVSRDDRDGFDGFGGFGGCGGFGRDGFVPGG